ncbi:MAG TPA: flagellar hook-associated protein FlgK [Terriglobales bacterium]
MSSGLFATLSVAVSGLRAEQDALNVTSNNIANANTAGYSRQRPELAASDPVVIGPLTFGTGVTVEKIDSLRDPILELRIHQETQHQGSLQAFVSGMQQIEVMFNSANNGDLGTLIANFFNSLQQLSTDPASLPLRQGVLTAAADVATGFQNTARNLQTERVNLDLNVTQSVQQVNTLTAQIADLNGEITALENVGKEAGVFIDQRNALINQLSALIDVSTIQSDNGLTLTTSNGTALLAGTRSFDLTTQPDVSGVEHIFSQGADITGKLTSGKLTGLLQVRDQKIPGLLANLDTLAAGLANAINTAHGGGFDLNGNPGGDFFQAPPAGGTGAAAGMAVALSDPALIAASSDGSAGSNGNVLALSAVHDQAVAAGQTPTDFYSNLVFGVGADVANGSAESDASDLVLRQLQDQRGSVSGVSLDEEAVNMIQFQRGYEAAGRMISTINEMLDVAVNLGKY